LCIAILDLDHFKRFNDRRGHQAGDLVLRESVAAWTEALDGRGLLARYGGEEFTLLLPGHTLEQAMSVVQSLRRVTPSGQTFSAGIAAWDPATEPGNAVARADEAMYVAKRNGRDRVVVHPGGAADPVDESALPAFTILLQPLVDVAAGRVLGHEAMCRFDDGRVDAVSTFRVAHEHGWGDLLEAAAIRAAMEVPGRPEGTELFITASVAALDSDRFWLLLPADLRGVVVELNEEEAPLGEEALAAVVQRIRSRGARVALDDLGAGASELTRMAGLRPDVIKIDRRLVHGCADDQGRCAVIGALVAYADVLGVLVCAEGVERSDDLRRLGELGITCMQGFLIGEPAEHWHTGAALALD
jgi:diguanylate cyclase (GGDEF)-like protein